MSGTTSAPVADVRRSRRRGWFVLLAAVLALGATVGVRPPHAPPLYDGIGFPDEPYRWVTPPPGQSNAGVAAPTVASATLPVAASGTEPVSGPARGFSSEQGPQVAFAVQEGAFDIATGVSTVEIQAVPKAPPDVLPPGGEVVSNLYSLTALADGKKGKDVPLKAGSVMVVNLRASAATPQTVVLCRWDGTAWNQVATRQVGTEIYAAQLDTLGPVALVKLDRGVKPTVAAPTTVADAPSGTTDGTRTASDGSGPKSGILLLTVGGVVVLLAAALLVLRRRSGDEDDS